MKAADARAMSVDQRSQELLSLKKELLNLRFRKAGDRLDNPAKMRQVRRDIARIKTVQGQTARTGAGEG